ncbi:MAG: NADH-quinone oxidoreductase subunit J [Cyclonatronaceae bacterium]
MELTAILFYAFTILTVGSAAYMVLSKNIVHAAFALIFSLTGVAALYVLLYADFIAATQILVYVGGILILILFGIMLTTLDFSENLKTVTVNMLPATILSGAVAVLLLYLFYVTEWTTIVPVERNDTMFDLGTMLMNEYLLPFQITGVLLLVAIIGALLMSTRNRTEQ